MIRSTPHSDDDNDGDDSGDAVAQRRLKLEYSGDKGVVIKYVRESVVVLIYIVDPVAALQHRKKEGPWVGSSVPRSGSRCGIRF